MVYCLPFPQREVVTRLVCTEPETNILKVMLYPKYLSQKALKIYKHYSCWLGRELTCKKEKGQRFSSSINRSCCSISVCEKRVQLMSLVHWSEVFPHTQHILGKLITWIPPPKARGLLQRLPLKTREKEVVWRTSCLSLSTSHKRNRICHPTGVSPNTPQHCRSRSWQVSSYHCLPFLCFPSSHKESYFTGETVPLRVH